MKLMDKLVNWWEQMKYPPLSKEKLKRIDEIIREANEKENK